MLVSGYLELTSTRSKIRERGLGRLARLIVEDKIEYSVLLRQLAAAIEDADVPEHVARRPFEVVDGDKRPSPPEHFTPFPTSAA